MEAAIDCVDGAEAVASFDKLKIGSDRKVEHACVEQDGFFGILGRRTSDWNQAVAG